MDRSIPPPPTAARRLAGFAAELRFEGLPRSVKEKTKLHFLDTLGIMVSGSRQEYSAALHEMVAEMGGRPEATAVGFGTRLPAAQAALLNGCLAHGQDFDDTHSASVTHPSSVVLPVTLAMAERQHANGADMLVAAVAGYEVISRMGAASPQGINGKGYHATGVCGAFGAAVAAGRLLGLGPGQLTMALGIVGSQASGIQEYLQDGSTVKRLHPGWAAHSGIMAALLAERGFTGPASVLEGSQGFFRSHCEPAPYDLDRLTRGLGAEWEVLDLSLKLYPACHHLHGALDAVLEIRHDPRVRPEDVREVTCYLPEEGIPIVCEPQEVKLRPPSAYAARFSLQYTVAAALVAGHAGPSLYQEDRLAEPSVLSLAERVHYRVDPASLFPAAYGGRVELVLNDGTVLDRSVPACKGSPQNPASQEEVSDKYMGNVREALSPEASRRLLEMVLKLESVQDLAALADMSRRTPNQ